ncbi:MAG: hypothetical protein H6Q10_1185 [Acidobacteria bacterium]|nr:hypothetical protein [Acidobacteriota bacterium]
MKRVFAVFALLGLSMTATAALAQIKTIPGDVVVKTATVEAINHGTRELTLKGPEGNFVTFKAPKEVKRFDELKVGDKITARYYDNVVIRVKQPGEKDVDTATDAATRTAERPGGTVAEQRTITATITQIDPKVPSITFEGPNNWKYSSRVQDKKLLATVKVGDKVDIVWTEAVLLDVAPPEKK